MSLSVTCRELYGYCVPYVGCTVQVSGNSGGCVFTWLALHYLIPTFPILFLVLCFLLFLFISVMYKSLGLLTSINPAEFGTLIALV